MEEHMKKIGIIGVIIIGFSLFIPGLYNYSYVRYGILIIIVLVLWMKKDWLFGSILKKIFYKG